MKYTLSVTYEVTPEVGAQDVDVDKTVLAVFRDHESVKHMRVERTVDRFRDPEAFFYPLPYVIERNR